MYKAPPTPSMHLDQILSLLMRVKANSSYLHVCRLPSFSYGGCHMTDIDQSVHCISDVVLLLKEVVLEALYTCKSAGADYRFGYFNFLQAFP